MTVTDADTAIAFRSGEVPVLATPRIVALVEEAAVTAVHPSLDPGCSTVGVRVQIEHISPTPVGGTVTAEANLEKVEGRRLIFHVVGARRPGPGRRRQDHPRAGRRRTLPRQDALSCTGPGPDGPTGQGARPWLTRR